MQLEILRETIAFSTSQTQEWFVLHMYSPVLPQTTVGSILPIANLTFEHPFTVLCWVPTVQVNQQRITLSKAAVTHRTLVRALSCMDSKMINQSSRLSKALMANFALIRHFLGV